LPPLEEFHIENSNNKTALLIICSLSAFLTPFMGSAMNLALPSVAKEFSMDAILLSWVATSYSLSAAIFLLPFGRIADIKGRELIFKAGIILFALFSILSVFSFTAMQLIIVRFLQGISGAMIFGTSTAILTASFPLQERGKVLGINISSVYLGSSLGPIAGGILTQNFGWRSIFFVTAAIASIASFLSVIRMKNIPTGLNQARFDWLGSMVYAVSLILIMMGFSSLPVFSGILLLTGGTAGIIIFGFLMTKIVSPVLDISVFKGNTVFIFSNIAALINYSATAAVGFLLSLYLQYIKGYTAQHAGLILVVQPIIMAVCASIAGRLSDRIEPRILATVGMALTTVGLGILIFVNETTTISFIIACLVFLGLGFSLFSSPNTNAAMSSVEKKHYGVASAAIGTMRLVGMMLSMGAIMMIFSLVMGRIKITPECYGLFLQSMRIGFILFSALCFAGIFASFARGNMRNRPLEPGQ
jgi:MFS family permease